MGDSSHLWNTVFISPNAIADRKRRGKAIPDATVCGYGMNRALPAYGGTYEQTKPKSVTKSMLTGAMTMLVIDNNDCIAGGANPWGDDHGTSLDVIQGRYDGKYATMFCDGHAEIRKLAEIPRAETDIFWQGKTGD